MNNIETSIVTLAMRNHAHTAHIASTSYHSNHTGIESNELADLASRKVEFDGIVHLDSGIRVADPGLQFLCQYTDWPNLPKLDPTTERAANSRSRVMRNQEWDSSLAQLYPLHFCQFVLGFLGRNAVDGEATLGVIDKTEVFARLFDGDHVHEASRVRCVGSYLQDLLALLEFVVTDITHFAIDFNETLHNNRFGFPRIEGILQTVKIYIDQ